MDDTGTKPRTLPLLNERTIRNAMKNLHVSMMEAPENAKTFLDCDPAQFAFGMAHGIPSAKKSLVELCEWLDKMKHFSFHGKIFEDQVMQPIKLAVEFVKDLKDHGLHTAKISGFVFSKSMPYVDSIYGVSRVTISMIVPSIQNAVSIRCAEELSKRILLGRFFDFSEVKPMPLANRLHQFHPVIKESDGDSLNLLQCDFLKTCFDDIESLSKSIEMENFTEIASSESDSRHYLGATLVVSGKILSVRTPRVTIQNAVGNNTATLLISTQIYENMSSRSLDMFSGKFVRMLVVCWYDSGQEPDGHPKSLEVFYVEEAASQLEIVTDDVVGFVRLRGKVSKKTVEAQYPGTEVEKISNLLVENNMLKLRSSRPDDPILARFVETNSKIRDLRSAVKSEEIPVVKIADILDPSRVSSEILLRKIKSDVQLQNILLTILKMRDMSGIITTKRDLIQHLHVDEESFRKNIWWLEITGLVSKDHENISLTKEGSEVMFKLSKDNLAEYIAGAKPTGIISIPEMEQKGVIPSLLVKYLREEGDSLGIISYLEKGKRCELFWLDENSKDGEKLMQDIRKKINDLSSNVILIFRNTRYPLTTAKVLDELKKNNIELSYFSANLLLSKLEREKKLQTSGNSWVYDLESRVMDLFSQEPDGIFAVHGIAEKISVPSVEIDKVNSFLNELAAQGTITEIRPGIWTTSENSMGKCKQFLKSHLKNSIFEFLKTSRAAEMSRIKSVVGYRARELCSKSIWKDANKITDEAIMEMVRDNKIILEDGMYRIKK